MTVIIFLVFFNFDAQLLLAYCSNQSDFLNKDLEVAINDFRVLGDKLVKII